MGKSLIIKGADFSANAVPVLPEGYTYLTADNANSYAQVWWNTITHQTGYGDTAKDTLYWNVVAGSVIRVKKSATQTVGVFLFLDTPINTVNTDYISHLKNNTPDNLYRTTDEVVTYNVVENCVFGLYQYDGSKFPELLIYKP